MADIQGTDGDDFLQGTGAADVFYGGHGDDILYGEEGDDVFLLHGTGGTDAYIGGEGFDTIITEYAPYYYDYTVFSISFMDGVEAIRNEDIIPAYIEAETNLDLRGVFLTNISGIWGTNNDNIIFTNNDNNTIHGYGGNDSLIAGTGNDVITGDAGNDRIEGGAGNDQISGGDGDDAIFGGLGNDSLDGGIGNDYFFVNDDEGTDTYAGGDGIQDAIIIASDATYSGDLDINIAGMTGIEYIANNSDAEVFINISGGYNFSSVALQNIAGVRGGAGDDFIVGNASLNTSDSLLHGISIQGLAGNDTLVGTVGSDLVDGGTGDDILQARGGDDVLTGGDGVDLFWFGANDGTDIITDYLDGSDKFVVGSDVSTVNVFAYDDGSHVYQALLQFDNTYVLVAGLAPGAIDASDLVWA